MDCSDIFRKMKKGKAFVLVGRAHWGKSNTLRALTNDLFSGSTSALIVFGSSECRTMTLRKLYQLRACLAIRGCPAVRRRHKGIHVDMDDFADTHLRIITLRIRPHRTRMVICFYPDAMRRRFSPAALAELESTKYLYIRTGDHRFIPIWVVVVDGRVVVRSWNDKPDGWYRAFLSHACGAVRIDDREVPVRAVRVRRSGLNDAADAAYASKYRTKANAKYVEGFRHAKRKATTLELVPA